MRPVAIDTNTNCSPHLDVLKEHGVTHVGRYYASNTWKRITRVEAKALSDAGLQLFCVFEDSGDPALTFDQGTHDAQIALNQARAIGQPEGSAVYFALEHLPHGYEAGHLPGIKRYVAGIKRVFGEAYKIGVYSDGVVLDALLDGKLIDYAWLSASTSFAGSKGFDKAGRWAIAQRKVDLKWEGLSVDTNEAKDDFGAFSLSGATIAKPSTVAEADEPLPAAPLIIPAADPPKADTPEKPGLWDRVVTSNAAKVNELADQGSRLADSIRTFKSWFWKGATVTVGGGGAASQFMDTTKGTGGAISQMVSAHPFLFAFGCAGLVAVLAYAVVKFAIERGLISAHADGRYKPRGA